jgi:hypothetical protein
MEKGGHFYRSHKPPGRSKKIQTSWRAILIENCNSGTGSVVSTNLLRVFVDVIPNLSENSKKRTDTSIFVKMFCLQSEAKIYS